MPARRVPVEQRFWTKIAVGASDACWLWKPEPGRRYGKIKRDGRSVSAHVVAYELTRGPVPVGLVVRHTCDVTRCCNPAHLLVGTHKDNTRDMDERGRRVGNVRLGEEQRLVALVQLLAGRSQRSVARAFGVSDTTISRFVLGKSWR